MLTGVLYRTGGRVRPSVRGGHNNGDSLHSQEAFRNGLHAKMESVMEQSPTSPMNGIISTPQWLDNTDLKLLREDHYLVRPWLDQWRAKVTYWTIWDFHEFYNREFCRPIFAAGPIPVDQYYYNVEESLQIIIQLLQHQFLSERAIREFLITLSNICERNIPKTNTILVYSPPSAGKNYFFDLVMDFYWNRGQIQNPNKHNQFAYQEAVGKRILLWNEPNYHSEEEDQLKMLLGGDACTVRVKCKQDMAINKTPVIILTNKKLPLQREKAFADRVKQYEWRSAPFLKDKTKKPTPLCYVPLLLAYGIAPECKHVEGQIPFM